MILADLGAEVIKVEPVDGDKTRRLRGFGGGFFATSIATRGASRSMPIRSKAARCWSSCCSRPT